jgi:hypothetical protein
LLLERVQLANVQGYEWLVLSAADGALVRNLGATIESFVWTGDGRLLMGSPLSSGFSVVNPQSGASTPVPGSAALDASCGVATWYEAGKVLVAKVTFLNGSDLGTCVPNVLVDVDTGATSPATTSSASGVPFAQSADGKVAAVARGAALEVDGIAGGASRPLGTASGAIVAVGWAHPSGGKANLVAPVPPPATAPGLAGAPSPGGRSGGTDCSTGRWVSRTPSPRPAGWPAPRLRFGFALDTDRSALLVEGGSTGNLPYAPGYETMEWDGVAGQWTNATRPDGFGPTADRAMSYDSKRKVILALGADFPTDGPWTWTLDAGWNNLRFLGYAGQKPYQLTGGSSVYDAGRDRWLVMGGYAQALTWEWDGATWQEDAAPGGTSQLAGARLVYDSRRGQVYALGNRDRGPAPWLYDPGQNVWSAQPSSGPSPLPREWAGVAYDARRDRVMVFGGFVLTTGTNGSLTGGVVGDLAEWDPATGAWQSCPVTGDAPTARENAAFAYDPARDVVVLYGGDDGSATFNTDLWEWYVP